MTNTRGKRKTRSDKSPLTLHPTGQYCKKIRGKVYYFGADKETALQRYFDQAAYLHSGQTDKYIHDKTSRDMSLKLLCNLYLDHQESRARAGEIKWRRCSDQAALLREFARSVGPQRLVADVSTMDLQSYRSRLIKRGKAANTVNNNIATVKALFNWAMDNDVIVNSPKLKAVKKIPIGKVERPTFSVQQIRQLMEKASAQMRAMIWLGLNCGFGCTDCSELKWSNIDLKAGRVNFPRGKTGIGRNLPLWPETVQAIQDVPKAGDLVFRTVRGNAWVRTIAGTKDDGTEKHTKEDGVSKEFSKLMKKTGIKTQKGMGFYTLRRTAATLTANSGDPFAVQKLLGHASVKMASTYVQNISEQADRAINHVRGLIVPDDSSHEAGSETDDAE